MVDVDLTGYLSREYAFSFVSPIHLPLSGGWMLYRPIPNTRYHDVTGLYPLLCCLNWDGLEHDLKSLSGPVSAVFVADPFANLENPIWLDLFSPYKLHHIVDFGKKVKPSKHHRYYARKAKCKVEITTTPNLETWCELYNTLVKRHSISGIQAFSRASFQQQLQVPGLVTFQAYDRTGILGMHLWYIQGNIAFSHLAACSDRGYEVFAAYALMDYALKFFDGNVSFLDLGGTADDSSKNGLSFFKKGWANDSRIAYLCGKILNLEVYKELVGEDKRKYFPAYRG